MTSSTHGALFIVRGRPYVDSQALQNLTRAQTVSRVEGGWRVQGPGGQVVLCLEHKGAPLPMQSGALYEVQKSAAETRLVDTCASWLASGAAELRGKYADWPTASGCGCGATCGCGPCKQRHGHAGKGEQPRVVSDEDAAQYLLDAVPFEVRGYVPETEKRAPSGFLLHLYLRDSNEEQRAVTFEVENRNTVRITWIVDPATATRRSELVRAIDLLIQQAYDGEENDDDPG